MTETSVVHSSYVIERDYIVFAYTMTIGDKRFSASLVTVELRPSAGGARLVFTEQGAFFEGADGPKRCAREAGVIFCRSSTRNCARRREGRVRSHLRLRASRAARGSNASWRCTVSR